MQKMLKKERKTKKYCCRKKCQGSTKQLIIAKALQRNCKKSVQVFNSKIAASY